jgi:hypothetical protein
MAAVLDGLVKSGQATELPTNISSEQIRQQFNQSTNNYPRGNDSAPQASAGGAVSGDISTEDTEEIFVDASLLDQHVRELIQAAGGNYDFRRAVENGRGRMVKIDDDLMDALERLEAAAPLLHRAVELAEHRGAMQSPLSKVLIKAGGSASGLGSGSGSGSGSASGDDSGDASTTGTHRTRRDAPGAGTESARARQVGSVSGSQSGSQSGATNKALAHRFIMGDRTAGLELLRRKMR